MVASYNALLKVTLLGGVPFFFLMGAVCAWAAFNDVPTTTARVLMLGMTAFFFAGGAFGMRLLPFVFAQCWTTDAGLHIRKRGVETVVPWQTITRVKDWPALQVLDVWVGSQRVLSVDYLMSNFDALHRVVMAKTAGR